MKYDVSYTAAYKAGQRSRNDEVAQLHALLKVAQCPDMDCRDGVVAYGPDPDGHWESNQCQWCDERDNILKVT